MIQLFCNVHFQFNVICVTYVPGCYDSYMCNICSRVLWHMRMYISNAFWMHFVSCYWHCYWRNLFFSFQHLLVAHWYLNLPAKHAVTLGLRRGTVRPTDAAGTRMLRRRMSGAIKEVREFLFIWTHYVTSPDSKVHGANMGPTWVLSAPDGPHVGPMNLAIRVLIHHWNGNIHH